MKKISSIVRNIMGRTMPRTLSKILFRATQGKKLDLNDPKLFDEKLMWLKLNNYNNNPLVWKYCDKYLVREYAVSNGVSSSNLPELLGEYQDANEIDFNKLPNKFALKCTHGCGFNIICKDKKELDYEKTRKTLNKWLKTKFGYESAELQYMHEKPRIICEKFIESRNSLPYDYKIYCFRGVAKCILVCSERDTDIKLNIFDLSWKELPVSKDEYKNTKKIDKPKSLNEMIGIAEKVSRPFPFVRVDFYEYNGKAILGEMTFTPAACLNYIYTDDGKKYLGDLLELDLKEDVLPKKQPGGN